MLFNAITCFYCIRMAANTLEKLTTAFVRDTATNDTSMNFCREAILAYVVAPGANGARDIANSMVAGNGIVATVAVFEGYIKDMLLLTLEASYYDARHITADDCRDDDVRECYVAYAQSKSKTVNGEVGQVEFMLQSKKQKALSSTNPTMAKFLPCFAKLLATTDERQNPMRLVHNLILKFSDHPTGHWTKFVLPDFGSNTTYTCDLRMRDGKSIGHITNLFYGIRNMICHGNADVTLNVGALSAQPDWDKEFNIEVMQWSPITPETPAAIGAKCKEYVKTLWNGAVDGESIQYDVYLNSTSFYRMLATIMANVSVCLMYYNIHGDVGFRSDYRLLTHKIPDIRDILQTSGFSLKPMLPA